MYDEKELRHIISRAIQLQRDAGDLYDAQRYSRDSGSASRLSQQELEEIARDAGLSQTYMRQAMAEFEGLPLEESFFVDTFDQNNIELIGFASGHLNPANWAELRSAVEKKLGTPGVTRREKDGMHWEARPRGISKIFKTKKEQTARIESNGRKLKIKLRKNVRTQRLPELPAWGFMLGAMAFLVVMLQTGDAEPIFGIVVTAGLASVCFSWANGRKAKARKQLNDLMLEMQNIITRHEAGISPGETAHESPHKADKRESASKQRPIQPEKEPEAPSDHRLKNKLQN